MRLATWMNEWGFSALLKQSEPGSLLSLGREKQETMSHAPYVFQKMALALRKLITFQTLVAPARLPTYFRLEDRIGSLAFKTTYALLTQHIIGFSPLRFYKNINRYEEYKE